MRDLGFSDIFTVSRILGKMKIRAEFKQAVSQEVIGMALMQGVLENLHEAEKEITDFIADLKGLKPAEVKKLTIDETFDFIEEFKNIPSAKTFFTRVSKLM